MKFNGITCNRFCTLSALPFFSPLCILFPPSNLRSSSTYFLYLWILLPCSPIFFSYIPFQIANLLPFLSILIPSICVLFQPHAQHWGKNAISLSSCTEHRFRTQAWAWAVFAPFCLCWEKQGKTTFFAVSSKTQVLRAVLQKASSL